MRVGLGWVECIHLPMLEVWVPESSAHLWLGYMFRVRVRVKIRIRVRVRVRVTVRVTVRVRVRVRVRLKVAVVLRAEPAYVRS